jgi:hypothetical protein
MDEMPSLRQRWNDAVIFARCWQDDSDELNELALT